MRLGRWTGTPGSTRAWSGRTSTPPVPGKGAPSIQASRQQALGLVDAGRVARPGGRGRPRVRPDHLTGAKAYSSRANRAALRARHIRHTIPERDDQRANRARRGARGGRPPAFAAVCGVSPVHASSGKRIRHRLNRGGDRAANSALWTIANNRLMHEPRSRAYAAKRTALGNSRKRSCDA
jgi:transposase